MYNMFMYTYNGHVKFLLQVTAQHDHLQFHHNGKHKMSQLKHSLIKLCTSVEHS